MDNLPLARTAADASLNPQSANALSKIEGIFSQISKALLNDGEKASISLVTRGVSATQGTRLTDGTVQRSSTSQAREIRFPGSTPREAWRFGEDKYSLLLALRLMV